MVQLFHICKCTPKENINTFRFVQSYFLSLHKTLSKSGIEENKHKSPICAQLLPTVWRHLSFLQLTKSSNENPRLRPSFI